MLEVRDSAVLPLHIGWEEWSVPSRAYDGTVALADASAVHSSSGWNWWDGVATKCDYEVHADRHRIVVDSSGVRATSVLTKLTTPKPNEWPAVRLIERANGSFLDAGAPMHFGFGYLFATWPQVRDISSGFVVRGRERVLDRDCLRVGLLYGGAGGSAKFVPLDVWFDDRGSLLSLRVESYTPVHDVEPGEVYTNEDLGALAFRRDGLDVVPGTRWEVLSVVERDGLAIPALGRVTSAGSGVRDQARVLVLDPSSFRTRAAPPQVSTELPRGGLHVDQIRDSSYVAGPGDKALDGRQSTYLRGLEDLGVANPGSVREFDFTALDFDEASCGVYAVQMLAHKLGIWCTIADLLDKSGTTARGKQPMTMADLESMARSQGLAVAPVTASIDDLDDWDEMFIAHTTHAEPGAKLPAPAGHYLLAQFDAAHGTVHYVNPPGRQRSAERDAFQSIWSGNALLVSRDAGKLQTYLERHGGRGTKFIVGSALLCGAALALGWLALSNRRKAHGHAH